MHDNMLSDLARKYKIPDTEYLGYLQEYGVISDNCVKIEEVVNAEEATLFILSHWRDFKRCIH